MLDISIRISQERIPMSIFTPSVDESAANETRVLEIASSTADLPVVGASYRVALAFNESYKVLYKVFWDVPMSEPDNFTATKGLLIHSEARGKISETEDDYIMLIRPEDDHYERIGITCLSPTKTLAISDCHSICDNDLHILDRRVELGHERIIAASDPRWWREYFKEETILLG
ncbi:hypothetical protein ST47_g4846 [Ascochyta rabiei]|uniref:Uncharacterized protein n=1 Tax=Didymella rabiei TaxID=5454 RepID=A0A163EU36_DIDRA|nr:hypothetical protein ST47_g4846 [Ascochyta rabiei]